MNLLSEHNRILRVGEGGSQEYFPGDNINITDHVISGKYWDNEINSAISSTSGDIVNEAFNQSTAWTEEQGYLTAHQDVSNLPYVQNSALEFSPQGLISGISGSGLYATSADNAFEAETANFAYNAEHADSADYAENVYSAQFANSASSALNAEVANVAYTALTSQFLDGGWEHDEDGFITAYNNSAFAGNGGGGRYDGISPIVVNNEEMRISAKSALLGVQEPLYFVEDSETATVIGIDNSAFPTFEGTPDGKISAINGSALNADPVVDYSAGNNIDITDHVISVTGSVQSADRAEYAVSATSSHFTHSAIEAGSAGSATYDNLGREITATYLTAVTGDNTPYSAGANIDITNHVVSGKDWTTEIQAASANAVDQIPTGLMLTSGLEYDPDNHYITAYNGSAIGKEATEYSAGPNIVINNHIIGLDSAVELTNITGNRGAILDPSGLYVSNLQQTTYTEIGKDHVFSTDGSASIGWQLGNKEISISDDSGNGDYAILHMSTADVMLEERHQEPTPDKVYSLTGACTSAISAINMINSGDNQAYSAGANIDITNHVVSGKDWATEIQNASSYAVDQATAQMPTVTEYSAGANINITNHVVSGKNWANDIAGASSYAYNQATAQIPNTANLPYVQNTALNIDNGSITSISSYNVGHPQVPVSGESGIYLTKKNGTVYIGYSGEGGGGGSQNVLILTGTQCLSSNGGPVCIRMNDDTWRYCPPYDQSFNNRIQSENVCTDAMIVVKEITNGYSSFDLSLNLSGVGSNTLQTGTRWGNNAPFSITGYTAAIPVSSPIVNYDNNNSPCISDAYTVWSGTKLKFYVNNSQTLNSADQLRNGYTHWEVHGFIN